LLSSLPKDLEYFVVAIETRDTLLDFESLCIKLKVEGERSDEKNIGAQALIATTSQQRNNDKRDKLKTKCYKCGKTRPHKEKLSRGN